MGPKVKHARDQTGDEEGNKRKCNSSNLAKSSLRNLAGRDWPRDLCRNMAALRIALQPLQVRPHFRRVLIAQSSIFFQSFSDDSVECRQELRIPLTRRLRLLVQNGAINSSVGVSIEGQATGCHLVERNAEGEKVRSFIERFARNLFRRHVANRAQKRVLGGEFLQSERGIIRP